MANDVLPKRSAIRSIVDAINTSGVRSWDEWEMSTKGPDRKNAVIFINWQEELRLSEVFEDFGFTSIKQGSTTLYSVALFNIDSLRESSLIELSPASDSPPPALPRDSPLALPSLFDF